MAEVDGRGRRTAPRRVAPRRKPPREVPTGPMVLAPKPVGVFAAPSPPDGGLGQAQRAAATRTAVAQRRVSANTSVAVVPKLARPTSQQRQAAKDLAVRSLAGQGIHTRADVNALPARERQRANRLLGYTQTLGKYQDAAVAGQHGYDLLYARTYGELARIGRALAARQAVPARAGQPDTRVGWGPATINLTAASRAILGATSLGGASAENAFVKNAGGDVAALGSAPFVGGYEVGRSAWDAAHGDTARGRRLVSGVWEGLKRSVPGELVQGHPNAALESFRQHPVFAALDVAGAAGLAGRAAGAVARGAGSTVAAGGVRGSLARAGSTVRPAIGLNADGGVAHVQRTYSKDLTRKAAQVAADRARVPLLDAQGRPVTVMDRGRRVPVLKAHPGEHELLHARRMDFTASRANAAERLSRDVTARDVGRAGAPGGLVRGRGDRLGKHGKQVVSMVTEGTIRPGEHFRPDLEKRLARLDGQIRDPAAAGYRHTGEIKKAQAEADAIRAVLGSQKALAQTERVVAAGQDVGRLRRAQDAQEIRLGTLDAAAAERARLEPYAIAHMDARHHTVDEHVALERTAAKTERVARAKVDTLPKGPARAQALAEWRLARQQRIETSGRHVAGVHAHEGARAAHAVATRKVAAAEAKVAKLERARQRLTGAQQVQRGAQSMERMRVAAAAPTRARGVLAHIDAALKDEGRLASGARKEGQRARVVAKVDAQIKTARAEMKAARAAEADARKTAAATKLPDTNAALRGPDGRMLPNEAIIAHMRQHGVDPEAVAQLSHRDLGNAAFHKRFDVNSRPAPGGQRRTGHAYERGSSGFGARQVEETAVNASTRVTKAQQIDKFVGDNALRHPALGKAQRGEALSKAEQRVVDKGGGFTATEAAEVADRLKNDTGREYVAVRMHGAKVSPDTQAQIRDTMQGSAPMVPLGDRLLNDRIVDLSKAIKDPAGSKLRNVALVPLEDINRLQRHLAPAGEIERALQMLNRPFRFSVLAQPRWLTGNFVEPFLVRLPMVGSGLVNVPGLYADIRAARKTLKDMERSGNPRVRGEAQAIRAQQLGGLFIGNRGASNRRRAADSSSRIVRVGGALRDLPVIKQLGDALAWLPNQYFRANRQLIEQWAQHAALGHQIRQDVQAITGSWTQAMVLGKKARAEAIKGLINTPTQERFMRAQHELLGKYEGFSPKMRRLVQTIAPFLPWALSAARFVFWTMPAHHTTKTALLLKSSQVFADEWAAQHADAPPGDLQMEPRRADGGFTPLARYTPYAFTGPIVKGDLAGIPAQFFPQLSGPQQALRGKDPFGKPLQVQPTASNPKGKPSSGQIALMVLNQLIESTAGPFPAQIRRLREGGGTPYADSTALSPKTKPGSSHMSAVQRTYDPFRPTYLKAPTAAAGAAAGGGKVDPADLHDIRQAVHEATGGLDATDLEEIRQAIRGG